MFLDTLRLHDVRWDAPETYQAAPPSQTHFIVTEYRGSAIEALRNRAHRDYEQLRILHSLANPAAKSPGCAFMNDWQPLFLQSGWVWRR
jgi:hypothetical protein